MACGCGCGQTDDTRTGGPIQDFADILEGEKQMDLFQAIQLLAGLATLIGVIQYLSKN